VMASCPRAPHGVAAPLGTWRIHALLARGVRYSVYRPQALLPTSIQILSLK
jgi:hypothetical protein